MYLLIFLKIFLLCWHLEKLDINNFINGTSVVELNATTWNKSSVPTITITVRDDEIRDDNMKNKYINLQSAESHPILQRHSSFK